MTRFLWITVLVAACGDDDGAAPRTDAGSTGAGCDGNDDCDDGAFCNGPERCMPSDPEADADGCVPGVAPCAVGMTCDETAESCGSTCDAPRDGDGDGSISPACGGNDCDDADPIRFPGNTEVCDVDAHDEDCDASTFGFRDADSDSFPDSACCNEREDATRACGTDCDDAQPSVHPTEAETCDGLDNDCDETIDEAVRVSCWTDEDEDGYAAAGAAGDETCGACPIGRTAREPVEGDIDCDDTRNTVNPAAVERCDGLDSDCSDGGGTDSDEDEDGDMHTAPSFAGCTDGFPKDDCDDRNADVFPGQLTYFARPYCPPGTSDGTCALGSCRAGISGPCMPVALWDYDCDGTTERQPVSSGCAGACAMMACPRVSGPSYSGTPACGTTVQQRTCGCGTGFTCRWTMMPDGPLGCR
jgi:hypothetical protein